MLLHPPLAGSGAASLIDRIDPRLRVVAAGAVTVVLAAAGRLEVPALGLGAAMVGLALSPLAPAAVLRRLVPLNLILLALVVLLPLTAGGTPLVSVGPLNLSREGLLLGAAIWLKGNAVVLAIVVLLGSLDATTLGHALHHLRVPDKLTHLLLFTVRYLDVLHREYLRLRAAMKVRAFRPRASWHTYRAYGYLVGMLLIRSFDRAERIVAAMRCRGFRGRFYLLEHFTASRRDAWFAAACLVLVLLLVWMAWS